MCDLPEQVVLALFSLGTPMLVWAAKLQREFYRSLQLRHPSVWASFGESGYFKYDESPRESAVGWYLLAGSFVYLNDEVLNTAGRKARCMSLAALALLCVGCLAMSLPTYDSVFACLPH
jgi:hypothetical protein